MDLTQAGQMHSEWKIKLRMAIAKQEILDATVILADDECPLGKWLHGEAKVKFSNLSSFSECVERHAAFHREAGKVAQTINAKDFALAKSMMDANTPYTLAANNFIVSLGQLKKEAHL